MKELEKLQKQGWIFAIWLTSSGTCIIQGKFGSDDGDFDFDVGTSNFALALKQALWEVRMKQRK